MLFKIKSAWRSGGNVCVCTEQDYWVLCQCCKCYPNPWGSTISFNSHFMLCVGLFPLAWLIVQSLIIFCLFRLFARWLRGICLADSPEGSSLCLSVSRENRERQKISRWRKKQQQLLIGQRNSSGIFPVSLFLCITATQVGLQIFDSPKPKDFQFYYHRRQRKPENIDISEQWILTYMLLFKFSRLNYCL